MINCSECENKIKTKDVEIRRLRNRLEIEIEKKHAFRDRLIEVIRESLE